MCLDRRCRIVVAHGNAVRTSSVERYKNRRSSKTLLRIEDFCGEGRRGRGERIEGPFDRRSAVASPADLGRSVRPSFLPGPPGLAGRPGVDSTSGIVADLRYSLRRRLLDSNV